MLKLSVIVPLAPGEAAWSRLVPDFASLPKGTQVLFVGPERPSELPSTIEWVQAPKGRAGQMNRAAAVATGDFFWFLHADSRLPVGGIQRLIAALDAAPAALHFFDLAFGHDSPRLMRLNAAAARLRSRVFKLPFGDQGFCLSRVVWNRLEGFSETAPYGEDHLLVWKALRLGIEVRPVGARLVTSARKYQERGWLKTTLKHQYLTYKQALPELVALVRERVRK